MNKKNNSNNKTNQTNLTNGRPIPYNESLTMKSIEALENLESRIDKLRTKPVAEVQIEQHKDFKKNQLK